ncbi:MAG: hypothetical protein J2P19_11625 [Pseudonocardia sp.]|nr:hypothetical protein [Pseudonocardia sp.]
MSTSTPSHPVTDLGRTDNAWASGLTVFAGTVMLISGVWHVLVGIAALVRDAVYVATPQYIYSVDLTVWGWIYLLLGVLVAVAGAAVFSGQLWARVIGIGLAGLSLVANFVFLPHYPIWSLLVIALDVAVIWALAVYRREPV